MPISVEIVEKRANLVREKLGISGLRAPDFENILNKLKKIAKKFDYKLGLSSEMGGDEALYDNDANLLLVREGVFHDLKAGQPRARFTVAHELGHYFLGHTGIRRRNADKSTYNGPVERAQEIEANIFASYFLVPTQLALDAESPEDISSQFQVSIQVAEIAFERISSIKRRAAGQLRRPPQGVIDFLKEAERKGYKVRSPIDRIF